MAGKAPAINAAWTPKKPPISWKACGMDEIIPALTDYIRIPNKSPAFDPDWESAWPYGKGGGAV